MKKKNANKTIYHQPARRTDDSIYIPTITIDTSPSYDSSPSYDGGSSSDYSGGGGDFGGGGSSGSYD